MAQKRKVRKVDKLKKKKWYKIYAPKAFNEVILGETPANKPENVINRVAEKSAAELFGQRKLSHIIAKFKVVNVKDERAETEIIGFRSDSTFLKRIVRRRRSKIDAIVPVVTKDGKKFRITMTTITQRKIESEKETEIRKIMEEEILKATKNSDYEKFLTELMLGIVAQKVMQRAKKVAVIQRIEAIKAKPLK